MSGNEPVYPRGFADEDIGDKVIIAAAIFIVLEIAVVCLRFATRVIYKTQWGLDDYLIPPALLFSLGMCIIGIVEVKVAGVGRHLDILLHNDPEAVKNWAKCTYALESIYCAAVAFPKLSILAIYLRIFTGKSYRMITYVLAGIVAATAVAGIIASLCSCQPFDARWDLDHFVSECIDVSNYWLAISVPSIVTDVAMLVLPMPVVWNLQVDLKQKLALSGVFLLGSLGFIAGCVRLSVTSRVTPTSDGTWDSADIAMWSLIETGFYVIAACLPVLRPSFVDVSRKVSSTVKGSRAQFRHRPGKPSIAESSASHSSDQTLAVEDSASSKHSDQIGLRPWRPSFMMQEEGPRFWKQEGKFMDQDTSPVSRSEDLEANMFPIQTNRDDPAPAYPGRTSKFGI